MGLLAGGLQLIFDPTRLSLNSFQTNLAVDPFFSCPGGNFCLDDPPGTLTIVWGQFLGNLIAPKSGATLMATLEMTALQCCGSTTLDIIDYTDITGGWFDAGFQFMSAPAFRGASITITTPEGPVPLPAGVWLMMGAIGALAGLRRKPPRDFRYRRLPLKSVIVMDRSPRNFFWARCCEQPRFDPSAVRKSERGTPGVAMRHADNHANG